jgi:hypothetical protein
VKTHLEAFVARHPDGWNHNDWLALLAELEAAGVQVAEPGAVGRELERTRLMFELERRGITGLGPKRRAAIVDQFGTLSMLRSASVEDVAQVTSVPRGLAEQVLRAIA